MVYYVVVCSYPFQELLVQLDKQERFEKLEETFQNVCDDYARILGLLK